ncbi:MAG: sensor histidine kinase [Gemmatimonadota bacterium]
MIVELDAVILQGAVTLGTAALSWYLYLTWRRADVLWWAVAWTLYVLRVAAIAAFLATGAEAWLFAHQILTGLTALALLWAALTFSRSAQWRPWYAAAVVFPFAWSYLAIYELQSFLAAALPAVLFLSFATLLTSRVFFVQWRATQSRGALVLAVVLFLWALHHLDYPLLRARGAWNPWGYYIDILFVLATGIGVVILGFEELKRRSIEIERISSRLLRQHEDDRRRLSLELHDQTAQVWAAVRMQLGLLREGAPAASALRLDRLLALVDSGIRSIRSVTTDLRPPLLDDLGLTPALRTLVHSFAEQTGLKITFEATGDVPAIGPDAALALYRVLQEALSNVARHADATAVSVRLGSTGRGLTLAVADDGRGFPGNGVALPPASPTALGLAGMRERIGALGGSVAFESHAAAGAGASVTVTLPIDAR